MGRHFNGTTDLVAVNPGALSNQFGGGAVRASHPKPFLLASGKVLVGYCANDDGGVRFVVRCKAGTLDAFGVVTSYSPSGTGTKIGGLGSGGSDTFEVAFAQLSGGTIFAVYGPTSTVCYRTSTDDGATWSSETVLTASSLVDPHPDTILVGTTLFVIYASTAGAIVQKSATVTSSTIGAFSAEVTVKTGTTLVDPSIRDAGDSTLIAAWADTSGTIQTAKSTDLTGASWGAAATLSIAWSVGKNLNTDANLMVDGSVLWLTYSLGATNTGATEGARVAVVRTSADHGTTWSSEQVLYQAAAYANTVTVPYNSDTHRLNGCLLAGAPAWWCTAHDREAEFHISRLDLTSIVVTRLRAQGKSLAFGNLTKFSYGGWFKYTGSVNAASNMFMLHKASQSTNFDRVLQLKNFTGGAGEIHLFLGAAVTNADYQASRTFVSGQWCFVAATFDSSLSAGSRCKLYAGTAASTVASLTVTVNAEPSGALFDDSIGPLLFGAKSVDQLRNLLGDLDGLFWADDVLSLGDIQITAGGINLPAAVKGFWKLPSSTVVDGSALDDLSGQGAPGLIFGTTAASAPADAPFSGSPFFLDNALAGGIPAMGL